MKRLTSKQLRSVLQEEIRTVTRRNRRRPRRMSEGTKIIGGGSGGASGWIAKKFDEYKEEYGDNKSGHITRLKNLKKSIQALIDQGSDKPDPSLSAEGVEYAKGILPAIDRQIEAVEQDTTPQSRGGSGTQQVGGGAEEFPGGSGDPYTYRYDDKAKAKTDGDPKKNLWATAFQKNGKPWGPKTFPVGSHKTLYKQMMAKSEELDLPDHIGPYKKRTKTKEPVGPAPTGATMDVAAGGGKVTFKRLRDGWITNTKITIDRGGPAPIGGPRPKMTMYKYKIDKNNYRQYLSVNNSWVKDDEDILGLSFQDLEDIYADKAKRGLTGGSSGDTGANV